MFSRVQTCKLSTLSILTGSILCTGALAPASDAVLIESAPDGWNHQWFKTEGIWLASTGKSKAPGLNGTSSLFNTADDTPGKATFAPDLPAEGRYEVFVTFSQFANSKGVKYRVFHAGGETDVVQDQDGLSKAQRLPNTWISLGTYPFKAGSETRIEISDPGTGEPANSNEPNVRVYADSIRMVPVEFKLPATFENKLAPGVTGKSPLSQDPRSTPATTPALSAPAEPRPSPVTPAPNVVSESAQVPPSLDAISPPASSLAPLPVDHSPGNLAPAGIPQPLDRGTGQQQNTDSGRLPVLPDLSDAPSSPLAPPSGNNPALPPQAAASSGYAQPPSLANVPAAETPSRPTPGLGLPTNPPALGGESRPIVSASLPSSLSDITAAPQSPIKSGASDDSPITLAPLNPIANSGSSAGLPSLAVPSLGLTGRALSAQPSATSDRPDTALGFQGISDSSTPRSQPVATPTFTPPPHEDDGTGIQWLFDYHAALSAARNQGKQVLVFFSARGNRVATRYTKEFFREPAVRTALDRFLLVKLDFPMNTRLGYRLGIFGAGQLVIVNGDDTKIGAITQMPASPAEFVGALNSIK